MHLRQCLTGEFGISIVDMVFSVALIATVTAISAPAMINLADSMRLGMSVRDVERELQFARLTSVATNRPMRIRFDCPSAGQIRVVELIGTPSAPDANDFDSVPTRCSESLYPYSPTGADKSRLTRPNNDGPIRRLEANTSFTAKTTLEFWPNGTVHGGTLAQTPWPQLGASGATITLARKGISKSIRINGLGKIDMDR